MTTISIHSPSKTLVRSARLLLVGASGLALSVPAVANEVLFTTSEARPATGERIDQRGGLTQIALSGGGTVSIVDSAEYRLNPDGSIDLYKGAITVAAGGGGGGEVVVRMPQGLEGRVAGSGAAALAPGPLAAAHGPATVVVGHRAAGAGGPEHAAGHAGHS
ncbi:MAG: hypothetical protein ACOVNS_03050, partial [Erythrobacter sp.]